MSEDVSTVAFGRKEGMSTPKDWWDKRYLLHQVQGPWSEIVRKSLEPDDKEAFIKLGAKTAELAANITRSHKYALVADYLAYYLEYASQHTVEYNAQATRAKWETLEVGFYKTLVYLYGKIGKGKMLVGVAHPQPLWVECPSMYRKIILDFPRPERDERELFDAMIIPTILRIAPFLSGESRQQKYDRLMLPLPDRWPNPSDWQYEAQRSFRLRISQSLGFEDGVIERDEYEQILGQALLERKYQLVPGCPVLVRLDKHPVFNQLMLMQKGDVLLTRLETHRRGDILVMLNLVDADTDSMLDFINVHNGSYDYSSATLVAAIYRDLVTVEKIEGVRRFTKGPKVERKERNPEDDKPKTYTTSWQYIPRRVYTRVDSDTLADREKLPEEEIKRQYALRRYHMVCGHIRRYRDKPDWMASGDKQDQAIADGIILRTGETYVKPHARGLSALEELGEIDLDTIPHYLRRGKRN